MKIDLHVHSRERSSCARSGAEEVIQAAIRRGLDAIAFTDHQRLVPRRRLDEFNTRYAPFQVFSGIEISVGEDLLVLGVHDRALETRQWTYPELHGWVRQRGGFIVLAHPFRYHQTVHVDLVGYPPDAIELRSINIEPQNEDRIRALAEQLHLGLLCNSDAHRAQDVGCHYNVLPGMPQGDADLVSVLRNGTC